MPIARPRSSGANEASMIARLPGVSTAAATPWATRAPISIGTFIATAHSTDATVKPMAPAMNIRRRP